MQLDLSGTNYMMRRKEVLLSVCLRSCVDEFGFVVKVEQAKLQILL